MRPVFLRAKGSEEGAGRGAGRGAAPPRLPVAFLPQALLVGETRAVGEAENDARRPSRARRMGFAHHLPRAGHPCPGGNFPRQWICHSPARGEQTGALRLTAKRSKNDRAERGRMKNGHGGGAGGGAPRTPVAVQAQALLVPAGRAVGEAESKRGTGKPARRRLRGAPPASCAFCSASERRSARVSPRCGQASVTRGQRGNASLPTRWRPSTIGGKRAFPGSRRRTPRAQVGGAGGGRSPPPASRSSFFHKLCL